MGALITYFKPFNHEKFNYSGLILEDLKLNSKVLELDVLYEKDADRVIEEINKNSFDFILLLGEARSRNKMCLEKRASNINDSKIADNNQIIRTNEIISMDNKCLETNIDVQNLLKHLDTNYVEISMDAGTFICNDLYYRVLQKTIPLNIPTLFVHIPSFDDDLKRHLQKELLKIIKYMEESLIQVRDFCYNK